MNRFIIIVIVFLLVPTTPLHAVRAGMDFTFIAHENGSSEKVTCDFCGYYYKKSKVRVATLSASSRHGVVTICFLPSEDSGETIQPQEPITSKNIEFEIDFFQKVQLREGQIVRLKGTNLKFELVDVFGTGCPPGAICSITSTHTA